jgi:hypothetical protein
MAREGNMGRSAGRRAALGSCAVLASSLVAINVAPRASAALVPPPRHLSWNIQRSPNPGGFSNFLFAATVISSSDAWAVGNLSFGAGNDPLAEHWDGVSWSSIDTPPLPEGGSLAGVAAPSSCDVWAVGSTASSGVDVGLIEHWDCNRWSVVPSPQVYGAQATELTGIASSPTAGVWAVGWYEIAGRSHTLVEHLSRTGSWLRIASRDVGEDSSLAGVALRDGDVWVVGSFTDSATSVPRNLIERRHNDVWEAIAAPNHGPGDNFLQAVAASTMAHPSLQLVAVGSWYSSDLTTRGPLVLAWNGSRWRQVANTLLPSAAGSSAALFGVAFLANGTALTDGLVSAGGASARTLIASVGNRSVRRLASPNRPPFDNELFGLATAPDGTAIAVGFSAGTGGAQNTLVERRAR